MVKYICRCGPVFSDNTHHVSRLDELDPAGQEGRLSPADHRPVVDLSKEGLVSQQLQPVLQLSEVSSRQLVVRIKLFSWAGILPFIQTRFPHLQ